MTHRGPLLALAVAVSTAIAVVVTARAMPPIVTSSDLAITELHTELAARGELLTGPDSRFAWNHPGPIYFYVLAPLYAAGGHRAAALFAAAVAINLAAIFTIAWVVRRNDGGPLLVFVSIACLFLAWRVPRLLASPWTAHIPAFASLTFIVLCGAVSAGRHRLLPLLILFGSFITQTHLSYVPMVGALSSVAVATVIAQHRRRAAAVLAVSAGLWILLWLPTLIDAAMNDGGNLAALWQFFVAGGGASHSVSESLVNWGHALSGIVRADLALPWGGHFVVAPSGWQVSFGLLQVAGLGLVAWSSFKRHRRIEGGIAACAAVASMVGFWSITRIHGDIVDHELFGLVALGALNLAILAGAVARLVSPSSWRWHASLAMSACVAALTGCVLLGVEHLKDFTSFELRRNDTVRIPATYESLRGFFDQRGIQRPLFHLDGDATSDGTGILLRFLQGNRSFAVEETTTSVFGTAFRKTGREDALVNFSAREGIHLELAARPGNVVIRDRHPFFVDVLATPR